MDTDLRSTLIICFTAIFIVGSGVGGCTYTVKNMNEHYYTAMNRCIEHGGTFVPGKGNSEAACVNR
jgi:hypothetical protein